MISERLSSIIKKRSPKSLLLPSSATRASNTSQAHLGDCKFLFCLPRWWLFKREMKFAHLGSQRNTYRACKQTLFLCKECRQKDEQTGDQNPEKTKNNLEIDDG
jgi:hypothetical protein